MPFAGSTAPQGYLLCDGSAVSRTDYADLFTAIGTLYGAGDGITTFNVPDLSGRVVIGVSNNHVLGSTGGEASHTLTSSELPEHAHEVPSHGHANNIVATTPALSHNIDQPVFHYNKPNTSNTSGSGTTCITSTITDNATRATDLAVSNHAASDCTMSGAVTDCAAFDSELSGGGTAHNNLQPYVVVNYIISIGG